MKHERAASWKRASVVLAAVVGWYACLAARAEDGSRPDGLGERVEAIRPAFEKSSDPANPMRDIVGRARKMLEKPIFKRVHTMEDYKLLDDVQARKVELHKRCGMIKDKRLAEHFALATQDLAACRVLGKELPLFAGCYRLTGEKAFLDYLVKQMEEVVTWSPLQRPGWTLRPDSDSFRKDGDGVWLATGGIVQAVVMMLDLLPKDSFPPELSAKIDELLEREMKLVYSDWKTEKPWYVKKQMPHSNQWIVPNSAMVLAAAWLGKDKFPEEYALGIENVRRSMEGMGEEGAVSEGWGYASSWTIPTLLVESMYMARAGDDSLTRHPFLQGFPVWLSQAYQPGRNLVNSFDWWGGNRDMYDRFLVGKIMEMAVLSGSPELGWIAKTQHHVFDTSLFSLIVAGWQAGGSQQVQEPPKFTVWKRSATVTWRSGWEDAANGVWLRGRDEYDFHAHNDFGHVNYIAGGKNVLIEAGTTGYSDEQQSLYFHRAKAHNTLAVNGTAKYVEKPLGEIIVKSLDESGGDVDCKAVKIYDEISSWTRSVRWDKQGVVVTDNVTVTEGSEPELAFWWHLATEAEPAVSGEGAAWKAAAAAGTMTFPGWFGDREEYWGEIPDKETVETPPVTVAVESDQPLTVTAEQAMDHTLKFRDRYHKHWAIKVAPPKGAKAFRITTRITAR